MLYSQHDMVTCNGYAGKKGHICYFDSGDLRIDIQQINIEGLVKKFCILQHNFISMYYKRL